MIRKVKQGDSLSIRAQDWNAIAAHVNGAVQVPTERKGTAIQRVHVYNDTGMELLRGMTVKLTATNYEGDTPLDGCTFTAKLPQSGEDFIPAVMAASALDKDCATALVSGIAPVRISSGSGIYGTPDGHGCLTLSDSGPIMVIPNAGNATWKYAILGGASGGGAQRGPFDAELALDGENWKLTCIDTLARQNAGIVHCGTHRQAIPYRTWKVTKAGVLFLDILYTPAQDGSGTYSINVFFEDELPAPVQDERRVIVRLAQVTGDAEDGFTLHKYRTPGDYTVAGRWVR